MEHCTTRLATSSSVRVLHTAATRIAAASVLAFAGCPHDGSALAPAADTGVAPDMIATADRDVPEVWTTNQLLAGDLELDGLTSDGYLVYHDLKAYFAVDTRAGTPQPARLLDTSAIANFTADAQVRGRVAFILVGSNDRAIGALNVWSSAHPASPPRQVTAAALDYNWDANEQGTAIYYTANAGMTLDMQDYIADIVLDATDHAAANTLVAQADFGAQCGSALLGADGHFLGGRFIATYCESGSDRVDLWSYDPALGTGTRLLQDTISWVANHAATTLLAVGRATGSVLFPLGGGMAKPLVLPGYIFGGFFVPDDSAFVYSSTPAGALFRASTSTGGSIKLQAGGVVDGVEGMSPDGKWVQFYGKVEPHNGSDQYLASTERTDAPHVLTTMTNTGGLGPVFTDDGAFALSGINPPGSLDASAIGAWPVPGGAMLRIDTTGMQPGWVTVGGAKLVYADNYRASDSAHHLIDLHAVDLARGATPTLLRADAYAAFFVTADRKTVWFSSPQGIFSASR